ncbi:MAG TPA: hypothetical protein VFE47_29890, partial [Tepidisphaeraceae bacterium]|nr:hypothetical protein [Tepidisphaeraceae bacterium]
TKGTPVVSGIPDTATTGVPFVRGSLNLAYETDRIMRRECQDKYVVFIAEIAPTSAVRTTASGKAREKQGAMDRDHLRRRFDRDNRAADTATLEAGEE